MLNFIRYQLRNKNYYSVTFHSLDMVNSFTIVVRACDHYDAKCVAFDKLIKNNISIHGLPFTSVELI